MEATRSLQRACAHVRGFSREAAAQALSLRGQGRQGGDPREGNVSKIRAAGERGEHGTAKELEGV